MEVDSAGGLSLSLAGQTLSEAWGLAQVGLGIDNGSVEEGS